MLVKKCDYGLNQISDAEFLSYDTGVYTVSIPTIAEYNKKLN